MYSVSKEYSKAITADTREMPYRVTLAGTIVLNQSKIPSMILTESASGSSGISIGTANSASLKLTLRDAETIDYSNILVEPESGLVLPNGNIEWVPLGKFWVTNSSTSNDYKTVTLTCADGMYHLTDEYESKLTYPTTVKAVVNEIVAKAGVNFVGFDSLPDVIIRKKPEKLTLREAIGYAAGCCGKNARFNRQGNLEFFWYEDTKKVIQRRTQYLNGMTKLNDKPLEVVFEVIGKQEIYTVNVISDGNGGVTATPGQNVLEGDTVTLSVNPFSGYELATITAVTDNGITLTLYKNANGGYTFVQPDSNVTVTASFRKVDATSFALTVRAFDGGGIRTSITSCKEGVKPIVYIKAEEGYELDSFVTTPASVSLTRLGTNADKETLYEFTMPKSDVTINAYFKEIKATYCLRNLVNTEGFTTTPGYIDARNLTTGEYKFSEGDIVEVNFICVTGYAFDRFESTVGMVQIDTNKYQFTMPASDVPITAYFKYAEDESKDGKYSWLDYPLTNKPPTDKPYWAVFYKYDATKPTCQRFYLIWFDSWSTTGFDVDGYGKRTYNIRFDGYYYCGSKNTGHQPHAWNTSSWSGNGALGSTLEWDSIIGSAWAANPRYSSNYCLLASNTHLYHNSNLLFQTCANAIKYTITDYRVDGEDVREQGALGYYKCPETFGTPAPASNWMILNSQSCLLMEVDDGEYTGYGAAWSGLYVVWFDSISVENIGAVFDNSDEEFFVATVTNGHYARLCEKSGTWGTLWDITDNQVIGLRNPAISEEHISGMLGGYYFNGVLASSCNIIANGSAFLRYKNNCKICDCAIAAGEEVSTFSLRRTVRSDAIVIDLEEITSTTDGDTIIIDSHLVFASKDNDVICVEVAQKPSGAETVKVSYSNPMLYEKSVESVSNLVQGITYTPSRVKHRGNPALQAGDIVTVPDKDGIYHTVLIMQQTMTFGGGMNSEIVSPGQTERQASFSANGPITAQIKNEVKQSNVELEHRLSTSNSLVFAALQRSIGTTEAEIKSVVEWQTEKAATKADIQQLADEHGAKIALVVGQNGIVNEDGAVQGSVVIEAINGESTAKISADRLDIEGKTLDIKVDATNIEGVITADKINASGLVIRGGDGISFVSEDSLESVVLYPRDFEMTKQMKTLSLDGTSFYSTNTVHYNTTSIGVEYNEYKNGIDRDSTFFSYYDAITFGVKKESSGSKTKIDGPGGVEISHVDAPQNMLLGTWYVGNYGSAPQVTSDRNKKNSIEVQPEVYSRIFDALMPVIYKYNNGESDRFHTGFIAQDVENAVVSAGLTTKDFAAVCYDLDDDGNKVNYGVRYEEIVSLNTHEIQKLKAKIKELEAKLGG